MTEEGRSAYAEAGRAIGRGDLGAALDAAGGQVRDVAVSGAIGFVSGGAGNIAGRATATVGRAAIRNTAGGGTMRTLAPPVLQGTGRGAVTGGTTGVVDSTITQATHGGDLSTTMAEGLAAVDGGQVAQDGLVGAAFGGLVGAGQGQAQASSAARQFGDSRAIPAFTNRVRPPGERSGQAIGVAADTAREAYDELRE